MKNIFALCVLLTLANIAYADEDECPAAVDVAEAQNQNLYKNCDYSQKGLNGVLHRALAGKKSDDNDNETDSESSKTPAEKNQKVASKTEPLKEGEFGSAQQLQSVKFLLLEKISLECPKGFVVESERYSPVPNNKTMKLELAHHCL